MKNYIWKGNKMINFKFDDYENIDLDDDDDIILDKDDDDDDDDEKQKSCCSGCESCLL